MTILNENEFKAEIIRRGMSIPKLAEKTGISKKRIYSKIKRGNFNQIEILQIKKVLNLTNDELICIFFEEKVS